MSADLSIITQPKIDCHCHVFDPAAYPYVASATYRPTGGETGSAAYLQQLMQAYGVRHALLVQPNSGYDHDHRCLLDAIAQSQGRFKGVAIVPADASESALLDLKAQGIVAVAHNPALLGEACYAGHDALWERMARVGLFLQVQVRDDQMARLAPRLRGCGATLLVDHHGRPDVRAGLGGPGMTALLTLAETGRCYVKLSGHDKFSEQAYPFADALPFTQALLQHFGPSHCLWASDWPHLRAKQRLDYGVLLALLARAVPDASQRQAILFDTPRRLFGFGESTSPEAA